MFSRTIPKLLPYDVKTTFTSAQKLSNDHGGDNKDDKCKRDRPFKTSNNKRKRQTGNSKLKLVLPGPQFKSKPFQLCLDMPVPYRNVLYGVDGKSMGHFSPISGNWKAPSRWKSPTNPVRFFTSGGKSSDRDTPPTAKEKDFFKNVNEEAQWLEQLRQKYKKQAEYTQAEYSQAKSTQAESKEDIPASSPSRSHVPRKKEGKYLTYALNPKVSEGKNIRFLSKHRAARQEGKLNTLSLSKNRTPRQEEELNTFSLSNNITARKEEELNTLSLSNNITARKEEELKTLSLSKNKTARQEDELNTRYLTKNRRATQEEELNTELDSSAKIDALISELKKMKRESKELAKQETDFIDKPTKKP